MIGRFKLVVSVASLLAVFTTPVDAQPLQPFPGRLEVGVGVQQSGGSSFGSREAGLTTSTGGILRLFNTSTTLKGAPGVEGRIGFRLARRLDVEGFGAYSRPALDTFVSADIENAPAVDATESIKQYVVGGAALWYLNTRFGSPRLRPFVIGSAAYLRQLHDANTLAVTGQMFEAGVGVKYAFVTRPVVPRAKTSLHVLGIRAEARLQARRHGAAFDDGLNYGPTAAVGMFFRF